MLTPAIVIRSIIIFLCMLLLSVLLWRGSHMVPPDLSPASFCQNRCLVFLSSVVRLTSFSLSSLPPGVFLSPSLKYSSLNLSVHLLIILFNLRTQIAYTHVHANTHPALLNCCQPPFYEERTSILGAAPKISHPHTARERDRERKRERDEGERERLALGTSHPEEQRWFGWSGVGRQIERMGKWEWRL